MVKYIRVFLDITRTFCRDSTLRQIREGIDIQQKVLETYEHQQRAELVIDPTMHNDKKAIITPNTMK